MKLPLNLCLCGMLLMSIFPAYADDPSATTVCLAMVEDSARNVGIATSSSDYSDVLFSNFCKSDGSTRNTSFESGMETVIDYVPLKGFLNGQNGETNTSQFCKEYASRFSSKMKDFSYKNQVVQGSLNAANECLGIANKNGGFTISYKIVTPRMLAINFGILNGQNVTIRDIKSDSATVSCDSAKIGGGDGRFKYDKGAHQTIDATAGKMFSVTCIREANGNSPEGDHLFNRVGLNVDSSVGELAVSWPEATEVPVTTAAVLRDEIRQVREEKWHTMAPVQITNLDRSRDLGLNESEGFCFITQVYGTFTGGDTGVKVEASQGTGYRWTLYVTDDLKDHLIDGTATCIKY